MYNYIAQPQPKNALNNASTNRQVTEVAILSNTAYIQSQQASNDVQQQPKQERRKMSLGANNFNSVPHLQQAPQQQVQYQYYQPSPSQFQPGNTLAQQFKQPTNNYYPAQYSWERNNVLFDNPYQFKSSIQQIEPRKIQPPTQKMRIEELLKQKELDGNLKYAYTQLLELLNMPDANRRIKRQQQQIIPIMVEKSFKLSYQEQLGFLIELLNYIDNKDYQQESFWESFLKNSLEVSEANVEKVGIILNLVQRPLIPEHFQSLLQKVLVQLSLNILQIFTSAYLNSLFTELGKDLYQKLFLLFYKSGREDLLAKYFVVKVDKENQTRWNQFFSEVEDYVRVEYYIPETQKNLKLVYGY